MFFALCAAEAGIFLSLLGLYRAATKPDLWSFFTSAPGYIFVCSSIVTVFSFGVIVRTVRKSVPANKRHIAHAIGMNLLMLILTIGSTELLARVFSKQTPTGETLFGIVLYPKDWSQFAAYYRKVVDKMATEGSSVAYDPMLGWTVAPSRTDKTGLYSTSTEGLRSPRPGMSFADLRARHSNASKTPASIRIALIGDSMTYGHEVRCEESWGHTLEAMLQPHTQVLNFALGAQGLNQALFRYERDARPWKPHIVIIGITSSMIQRNNNIYPFLKDPEWGSPFARPRFVMEGDALMAVNEPVTHPKEIFDKRTISEVPNLELDDYYRPFEWKRGGIWRLLEESYIFRFTYSLRPPSDDREEQRNTNAIQLGEAVIKRLVLEVSRDGAVPLVVYLPYKDETYLKERPRAFRSYASECRHPVLRPHFLFNDNGRFKCLHERKPLFG